MLSTLTLTPATVVILLILATCVVLAVSRMLKRGLCDCGDHCDRCARNKGCNAKSASSCSSCSAADDMVARMESSLGK